MIHIHADYSYSCMLLGERSVCFGLEIVVCNPWQLDRLNSGILGQLKVWGLQACKHCWVTIMVSLASSHVSVFLSSAGQDEVCELWKYRELKFGSSSAYLEVVIFIGFVRDIRHLLML